MRTTLAIRDDLLAEAKRRALDGNSTLSGFIEETLRVALARPKASKRRCGKVSLRTFRGRGLRPGVDINHTAALLDVMESR